MNSSVHDLQKVLEFCFAEQVKATALWHESEPRQPGRPSGCTLQGFPDLVMRDHYFNFQLWHVEDEARRKDVDDSVIAGCKRSIDALNQQRNDSIEEVDRCICDLLLPLLPEDALARQNTETAGMAMDRLSILALKIYHMEEQASRTDAGQEHIRSCEKKLSILRLQREGLIKALVELVADYAEGRKSPVLYSQFKMYNDPSLNPQLYGNKK